MSTKEIPFAKSLPWWTWIAPLLIIETGDRVSVLFFQDAVTSSFYLPTSLALILVFWWGPARVFPSLLLITTFNNYSYGFTNYWVWLDFGLGDSLAIVLSWFLFIKIFNGKFWLPDTKNTVAFLLLGLAIPILGYTLNWQLMYIIDGEVHWNEFAFHFRRDILSELIVNCIIVIPALVFLTPPLSRLGLISVPPIEKTAFIYLTKKHIPEIMVILLTLGSFFFFLSLDDYWFIFGMVSLFVAIRFGFDAVLCTNVLIFSFTYLVPAFNHPEFTQRLGHINDARAFFGYLLLFLFSAITGRVISDLRFVEHQLNDQNKKLQQTNLELDRFVYSASHDMSAPLKSIRGLVNVGRMTNMDSKQILYYNKIETSALRLENFIKEVLDYSRNNRTEILEEEVDFQSFCEDIFNGLRYADEDNQVTLIFDESAKRKIITDASRLKIILNNLLSNAIKYQKKNHDHQPSVNIDIQDENEFIKINIKDNGEGMPPEVQSNIFKMFYRGNLKSSGSGLGLYIALEAAQKLKGNIIVKSQEGIGTIFTLILQKAIKRS